ncbi:MAG: hypothetical protein ACRD3V_07225 [Vicinamibacteria bacterium]
MSGLDDVPAWRRDEVERGIRHRLVRVLKEIRSERAEAATDLEFADPESPYNAVGERLWATRAVAEILEPEILALINRLSNA